MKQFRMPQPFWLLLLTKGVPLLPKCSCLIMVTFLQVVSICTFGSNYSLVSWISLYKLCTSGCGNFLTFFLAGPLKWIKLSAECLWTTIFTSLHECSLGLAVSLKDIQRLVKSLSSLFFLAVCFGLLSWRKVYLYLRLRACWSFLQGPLYIWLLSSFYPCPKAWFWVCTMLHPMDCISRWCQLISNTWFGHLEFSPKSSLFVFSDQKIFFFILWIL